jgi:hypothetical protein
VFKILLIDVKGKALPQRVFLGRAAAGSAKRAFTSDAAFAFEVAGCARISAAQPQIAAYGQGGKRKWIEG